MIKIAALPRGEAYLGIKHATPKENIEPLSLIRVANGVRASRTLEQVHPFVLLALKVEPKCIVATTFSGKQFAVPSECMEPAGAEFVVVEDNKVVASAPVLTEIVDVVGASETCGVGTGMLLDALDNVLDRFAATDGDFGEWKPGDSVQVAFEDGMEVMAMVAGAQFERDLSHWYRIEYAGREYLMKSGDVAAFNAGVLVWENPTTQALDKEEVESSRFSCYHPGSKPIECRSCWEKEAEPKRMFVNRAHCAQEGRRFRD